MSRFNILLSSGGRRIALLRCFREALRDMGKEGRLLVVDAALDAPAAHLADGSWLVPRCEHSSYISAVLEICRREEVDLLVPTIDAELDGYAAAINDFREIGTVVCISRSPTVRIAGDKIQTHDWLARHSLPTVRQATAAAVLANPDFWRFPVIVKPRSGSASFGVRHVHSLDELAIVAGLAGEWIVQELGSGDEYTINLFVDRSGKCRCAVPHRRLEIRAGEVSKAFTVKHRPMMDAARRIAEKLPGAYGPLNVQCFLSPSDEIQFIEVNARFGGGYPLAHRAGAHFTRWILEEALNRPLSASFDDWQDDLAMLRYDEAIYLAGQELREPIHETVLSGV